MHAFLLIVAISVPGLEHGEVAFQPSAAEGGVPEPFRLDAATFSFEREDLRTTPGYSVSALRFPSPVVTPDPENNTVHAEYFLPKREGKRPAVVVLHILGADFALSRYLAARLADQGVAALFLKLPYYGERRPADGSKRFLSVDLERSMVSMRQGVCDVRRASIWLASRPEVDSSRLGVAGISLGGIVASLAAAVDPSIHQAALLLAGGDLAEILWTMPEARGYRELWTARGKTKADLAKLTDPFDPLRFADRLKSKRILMIAGKVDEVVPPSSTLALWKAAGQPSILWYDCGHYSAAGFLLPAVRETVTFFATDPPDPQGRPGP